MITDPITSSDHLEIRDMVADFAAATFTSERVRAAAMSPLGYDTVAWKQMVELGWAGLGVSEAAGGEDLGAVVQCIVHRELGATLAPTPYLASAAFAATALTTLGSPGLARPLLTSIVDGTVQCALVLTSGWPDARTAVSVAEGPTGWTLTGQVNMVLDGARAPVFVVVAADATGAWNLFAVDAADAGIAREAVSTIDATRTFGHVHFDRAGATRLSDRALTRADVSTLIDTMSIFLAAEMVGSAMSCHRRTLAYLRTRHQFGKPIGSFQALKHRAADIAVSITAAQEFVFSAAALIGAGKNSQLALAAPLTLARVGEVLKHTTEEAIQLHGAVGFTDEVDIGLYYKRALSDLEMIAVPADAYARLQEIRSAVSP
jgi:alkylation response protein AidB-like acyl-CoA dehydrogenase